MTKAEKLIYAQAYFTDKQKENILSLMKLAMGIGYDTAIKMSAIRKDSLINQWFEAELPEYNAESLCHS